MICRICNSSEVKTLGEYQPYTDFKTTVYECVDCHCRFSDHDDSTYEKLHASRGSHYGPLIKIAEQAASIYRQSGTEGLRAYLRKNPRSRFVIDTLDAAPDVSKILEVGCSRGTLAAYFIGRGAETLGIDVSPSAIESARNTFGNHFALVGDPIIESRAPYDAIYHIGTIGSIKSPIDFTNQLLSLLRPGGILLFNSPNVDSCKQARSMWVSTPPPDVVTLFDESFWKTRFSSIADADITYQPTDGFLNVRLALERMTGRNNGKQPKRGLFTEYAASREVGNLKPMVRQIAGIIGRTPIWPKYATEYGLFVSLKKR